MAWYVDCFVAADNDFPVNTYGPYETQAEAERQAFRVRSNKRSGIGRISITQSTRGCNPRQEPQP